MNGAGAEIAPTESDAGFAPELRKQSVSEDIASAADQPAPRIVEFDQSRKKQSWMRLQRPATFKIGLMASTRNRAIAAVSFKKSVLASRFSKITIALIFLPSREPVHINISVSITGE
jgi:hypothetical protein